MEIKCLSVIIYLLISSQVSYSQSGWFPLNSGTAVQLNCVFFINPNTGFVCGGSGYMLKTTNAGMTWVSQQITANTLYSVFFTDQFSGYAGAYNGLIFATTNTGQSWYMQYMYNAGTYFYTIHFPSLLTGYAGGYSGLGLVKKTTDAGTIWLTVGNTGAFLRSLFFLDNNTGYAANNNGDLDKTTNGGASWPSILSISGASFESVRFVDYNTGWVSGGNGLIRKTTNGGSNWVDQSFSTFNRLWSIYPISPTTGYIAGGNMFNNTSMILKTTNGGSPWLSQPIGTTNELHSIFFTDSLTGYAVGINGTILKTTTGGVTYIAPISNEIPSEYQLFQNYPNPFNPKTAIGFQLPKFDDVNLTLFDILGREIETLVNEKLKPGTYEVQFDGTNYPSGVYYYRLSAGDYTETRKLVLLK